MPHHHAFVWITSTSTEFSLFLRFFLCLLNWDIAYNSRDWINYDRLGGGWILPLVCLVTFLQQCVMKKISHRQLRPLCGSSSLFRGFEPARSKPSYVSIQSKSAIWPAVLTASAFNRLAQFAGSTGNWAYCYAELAVSCLVLARTHFA